MTPFPQPLVSPAAPLLANDVDTDTIIPSREMRTTGRSGLADGLFAPWRYTDADARVVDPGFVLNRPEFRDARVLVAGANFGCGSSREHAVWALTEWGIRAILAESFAPIFAGNCLRNGVLAATFERATLEAIAEQEVTIDLARQQVRAGSASYDFTIDPEAKQMLADGLDAIDLTLTQAAAIDAWTARDRAVRPWVYLEHTP